MPNYKELYFNLYAKVADLTDQLIDIQKELEENYVNEEDIKDNVIPFKPKDLTS